jgi:hypothetical protein
MQKHVKLEVNRVVLLVVNREGATKYSHDFINSIQDKCISA